jgi:hypothetical protein
MSHKIYDNDNDNGNDNGKFAVGATIGASAAGTMASSFVKKLFDMVENESDEIISWVANGTAFEVKDPKRLEVEILPNFFRHGRFQSLVRQLNFYAFKVLKIP